MTASRCASISQIDFLVFMTPEYLKEVLPSLLNADLAGATNIRLLSLVRAYAALCSLATFDSPAGEYGPRKIWLRKIDTLFGALRERSRRESDIAMRCRMVHAMYTLVCGTMSGDVSKKKDLCFAMADELVRDCLGGDEKRSSLRPDESELSIRTGVCHCLIDLLYPGPDADDEYLLFLKRQIAGWIAEMNRDGSWNGVSPDVALERVGVMNRYSCMLLDRTNDKAVKRSFETLCRFPKIPGISTKITSVRWACCTMPRFWAMRTMWTVVLRAEPPASCTITAGCFRKEMMHGCTAHHMLSITLPKGSRRDWRLR